MEVEQRVGAIENPKGTEAGKQVRLKGTGKVAIRQGECGMVAGMEIIGH